MGAWWSPESPCTKSGSGTIFTTIHLLRTLHLGPLNQSIRLHWGGKACRWQTLELIGPICKLQTKLSIVNMTPMTIFTALHFLLNLHMDPLDQSIRLRGFGKACQWQTLKLIGPICKSWWKWSVVNMTPVTVFTALHLLHDLWMGPLSYSIWLHWVGKAYQCHTL